MSSHRPRRLRIWGTPHRSGPCASGIPRRRSCLEPHSRLKVGGGGDQYFLQGESRPSLNSRTMTITITLCDCQWSSGGSAPFNVSYIHCSARQPSQPAKAFPGFVPSASWNQGTSLLVCSMGFSSQPLVRMFGHGLDRGLIMTSNRAMALFAV